MDTDDLKIIFIIFVVSFAFIGLFYKLYYDNSIIENYRNNNIIVYNDDIAILHVCDIKGYNDLTKEVESKGYEMVSFFTIYYDPSTTRFEQVIVYRLIGEQK